MPTHPTHDPLLDPQAYLRGVNQNFLPRKDALVIVMQIGFIVCMARFQGKEWTRKNYLIMGGCAALVAIAMTVAFKLIDPK